MNLTQTQWSIFRAVRTGALDTDALLERLYWLRNRHNLKTQIYLMRRKGVAIRGNRGGDRHGGYRIEPKTKDRKQETDK